MSSSIKSSLDAAKLLNRYYERRAISSLPNAAPTFQFGKILWANDLVRIVDGKSVLQPIPNDLAELKNVFLTNDAVYTYLNGVIYVRCAIPTGKIPEGEQHCFTACGIQDEAGGLIAVGINPPVWVYTDRGMVVEFEINTNIA